VSAAPGQAQGQSWSRQLAGILGDDLDAVRHCNQLLSHLEQRLTDDRAGPADRGPDKLKGLPGSLAKRT
jgi:hypothetical protein